MICIVADDLTGAADTGVQFSKNGFKTVVYLLEDSIRDFNLDKIDVLVIDSESRDVNILDTKKRIKNILNKLNIGRNDIVYKKVDSTLRGNIGAEIDEIMKNLQKDLCIFSPSLPPYNRTTIGGSLFVDGKPLLLSEYYHMCNDTILDEGSSIAFLLKQQTELPIAQIDLKDVKNGHGVILEKLNKLYEEKNKIIIIDATEEMHLRDILQASFKFKGSVLYAGSAGLAEYLSEIRKIKGKRRKYKQKNNGPALLIGGSRNKIMISQINHLKSKEKIIGLNIDVSKIIKNRKTFLEKYIADALKVVNKGDHLIIYPDPIYLEKESADKLILKSGITFRKLEIYIRDFLGDIAAGIMKEASVSKLILIGGDTAYGVCSALGIYILNIRDELLPGVPISIGKSNRRLDINIITKAGGFGREDTLYKIISLL